MSHFTNDPDPLGHTPDDRADDDGACPNCDGTSIDPDTLGTCRQCWENRPDAAGAGVVQAPSKEWAAKLAELVMEYGQERYSEGLAVGCRDKLGAKSSAGDAEDTFRIIVAHVESLASGVLGPGDQTFSQQTPTNPKAPT